MEKLEEFRKKWCTLDNIMHCKQATIDFFEEMEELIDNDEITEETKNEPQMPGSSASEKPKVSKYAKKRAEIKQDKKALDLAPDNESYKAAYTTFTTSHSIAQAKEAANAFFIYFLESNIFSMI